MAHADDVRVALRTGWQWPAHELAPLPPVGGQPRWLVDAGAGRYVARLVSAAERGSVEAGLAATEHLLARGLPGAAPVRTADGALTHPMCNGVLVLRREPSGRPLEPADPVDQRAWGELLGAAHRELAGFEHPGLLPWHRVRPDAAHLGVEPWLRAAVGRAVAALTKLAVTDQLTYGVLHGDPVATAFHADAGTGGVRLLRWGAATTGPLVYDVAAAVIDAGGPRSAAGLLDGYVATGPVGRDELEAALPVMMRFRWAEQADSCARRLTRGDAGRRPAAPPDPLAAERRTLTAARAALGTG